VSAQGSALLGRAQGMVIRMGERRSWHHIINEATTALAYSSSSICNKHFKQKNKPKCKYSSTEGTEWSHAWQFEKVFQRLDPKCIFKFFVVLF
jgi:hypothetical protein